ncbi:MAG: energy transducer TonB [Acidobacteriota bacterium]|nr:energy transducer TonB [Acidobacteriota bacterium]
MLRRIGNVTLSVLALSAFSTIAFAQSNLTAKATVPQPSSPSRVVESDRVRDGLIGPVRRVRTEIAKLSNESGRLLEGKHAVLEVTAYDIKGNKVENQYFPIAGANLTGKEVYKYDDKGNISEMTLVKDDGTLLSKEVYKYEFDFAGNWNKMTTSVAVIEAGKMSFEPSEVTYRAIMYYLDENMMKMAQPTSQPGGQPSSSTPVPAGIVPHANSEAKGAAIEAKSSVNNGTTLNQKSSSLPESMITAEKLNATGSLEVGNARTNSNAHAPTVKLDSEPPPPPAPKPVLKPVSGGVLNGTAISLPSPIYPETARRLRLSGVVTVEVVVDETGKVIAAQATSGPAALRDVAVQAALRARFSPTMLSGQPLKVSGIINYKFGLPQ